MVQACEAVPGLVELQRRTRSQHHTEGTIYIPPFVSLSPLVVSQSEEIVRTLLSASGHSHSPFPPPPSSSSFFLLIGENGGVLLHGVRCIGRGGGGTGAEQEQQGPNQHIFRLQFLQEQLPPRIFPHDGYAITSDLSLPFLPLSDREGSRAIAPLLPLDLRTSSVLSLICSFCGFRVRSGRAFLNAFCCCVLFV